MGEIADLIAAHRRGDKQASTRLFELVYEDLRHIARAQLRGVAHTLSPTGLVHESYLKLCRSEQFEVVDQQHFIRLAAKVMRQIVVDYARERFALKRGGGLQAVTLDDTMIVADEQYQTLLVLEEALGKLEAINERLARVVELRFFGGLGESEIAELLGVNSRTVQRDWVRAKTWLAELMGAEEGLDSA